MARADKLGRTTSDHVFTIRADGLIIEGDILLLTDPVPLPPGAQIDAHFQLPNDGKTRRVCCAVIVLEDAQERILLPGGIKL